MPVLADFQEVGEAKPGAVVLAEVSAAGKKKSPLLVTENYGRGRTALFATSGSWRWQMMQDHTDRTHEMFWGQLLRWLVTDTPGRVLSTSTKTVFADETKVRCAPRCGTKVSVRCLMFVWKRESWDRREWRPRWS